MNALARPNAALDVAFTDRAVQSLAFNANGRLIATGDVGRRLRAWHNDKPFFEADLRSEDAKGKNTDRIRALAFSPDGRSLYVASGDTLRAFDLLTRQENWRFQPRRSWGLLVVSPQAVAVSPAGNVLTTLDSGVVFTFGPDGKRISQWWDNDAPRQVAFTPTGDEVVGTEGFSVCVWQAYTGRKRLRARTSERVFGMALAPLTSRVALRTLHRVEILDLETLEMVDWMSAPPGLPLMAFSPDGNRLALAGREEVVLVGPGNAHEDALSTNGTRVLSLAFSPTGHHLAAGCSDGVVRFWDTAF